MNLLLIGDGPLAQELAILAEAAGHHVHSHFLQQEPTDGPEEIEKIVETLLAAGVDVAIEAVIAEPTEKWDVITELDRALPAGVPILTAALNASATEVASWCHHPARVVGFAALPPLDRASVVELMPALQSDEQATEQARAFWRSVGREPVPIRDSVGGVLPRVVCALINEAAHALMEGVATPEDIDLAMQLGTNFPRGPLAWADLIHPEQVVAILEALGNEFGPDSYLPAPLLRQLARAGRTFYPSAVEG